MSPHLRRLITAALALTTAPALAQLANEIITVSPTSAVQGATGVTVTFTLDGDAPPAPPAGINPGSVSLGSIAGSSVTHTQ